MERTDTLFIYITTNNINGKKYIGLCTRDDENYLGSGSLIKAAIAKYGKKNFTREVVERCTSFEELCEAEKRWIKNCDADKSEMFYNLAAGGRGGCRDVLLKFWSSMSPEERKTARNWNGHFMHCVFDGYDDKWKKAVSAGVKKSWQKYTPEEKKNRMSVLHKANAARDISGKNNPMHGRSAVKEKNLKWYNNGTDVIYVTEGTQPPGYTRGRKLK